MDWYARNPLDLFPEIPLSVCRPSNISASNFSNARRCNATIMSRPRPLTLRFMYQPSFQRYVVWVTNTIVQLTANEAVLAYRKKLHQEVVLLDDMKAADQTPSWRRGSEEKI